MEPEIKSVVVATPLSYEQKAYSSPNYKLLRVTPLQGTQTYTLSASRQQLQFEFPANECFNLSRSYLQMTLNIAAQTVTPAFARVFNDTIAPISSINLRTRSGVVLCDLDFCNQYVRIANRIKTRVSQYLSDGERDILYPSKSLGNIGNSVRCDGSSANSPYVEPSYVQTSADLGAITKYYNIPLSVIAETIFEVDKDLWFGEVLLMTINVAPLAEIGFRSGGTDPTPQTAAVALTGANTLSDICCYLATEQNVVIKKQVMDLVQAGKFKMILPYVHYFTNLRNATGAQSVSLRFNKGHGEYLRSVLHIPVNSAATVNTVYDSINTNGAKISRYYVMTNNMRDEDYDAMCNDTDASLASSAWTLIRDSIKGSVAGLNDAVYFANFFVLSDYTELGNAEDQANLNTPKWNLQCGKSLESEVKWDIVCTQASANINHYTFARVSKSLTILPNLVIVS